MAQGGAEWERSKENILPMRSGRDVNVLNEALGEGTSDQWKEHRLKEWRAFQDRLVQNESHKEELLNAYYDLICWLENTFPQGGKKYIKLHAKKCFHKLKDDKSFYSNWKFMTVMIKYIEASGESCRYISETSYCDLFNYMFINRIGTMHADFYVSWAHALEASESYPQASQVYAKGMHMNAEPRETLEKEKRLFEDRMALRTIEEMMKGEEGKLPAGDRRQPLQDQSGALKPKVFVSDEDSVVKAKKPTSSEPVIKSQKTEASFAVMSGDKRLQAGPAAFTAVAAPSAQNVVPTKHNPDKENSQKPEQWAKPSTIGAKPSAPKAALKPKTSKIATDSFTIYCDESEQQELQSHHPKGPIVLGQSSVLKPRKEDDEEDLFGSTTKKETKKEATKEQAVDENVKFMFCEDAVMNGPMGEMSFEELRASHVFAVENQSKSKAPTTSAPVALKIPVNKTISESFLAKDDDDDENNDHHFGKDKEADLTMALNAEVSRRDGLSNKDRKVLGHAAFADSMMAGGANDSWSATVCGGPNETAESVRLSHDDSNTSMLPGSQANQTAKLSVTQLDCLKHILSEAFRGPSQASSVNPPFGMSDETISSEDGGNQSIRTAVSRASAKSNHTGASEFVAFEDSMLKVAEPKADFFVYEDSFAQPPPQSSNKRAAIGLKPRDDAPTDISQRFEQPEPDFVMYNDSFAPAPQPASTKKPGLAVKPDVSGRDFVFQDESPEKPKQNAQKRVALKVRSDETASSSGVLIIDEGSCDSQGSLGSAPVLNSSESPQQKRSKGSNSENMFSDGLADCSGIVADFPVFGAGDSNGATFGGGRFSLSTTIDFNPGKKFCSTGYVDMNMLKPDSDENPVIRGMADFIQGDDDDEDGHQLFAPNRPPVAQSAGAFKRPPGAKRQSITSRVSMMPPLAERSESSSSGGSTMAMHSALHTVRESGLSAIWESNNTGNLGKSAVNPPAKENGDEEEEDDELAGDLPTINCELQKSHHRIDIEKYVAFSQLQQTFADKTYSCLREIDPTDPFSDELVARFVKKYEPSLRKAPNYVEVDSKMPQFFSGNQRQSTVGKVVQLAPNYSMVYAFQVGSGAYASVIGAREVDSRKLYALKFQTPACKWEFYIAHELRERLKRKFAQMQSVLDGVMNIERAFIYKDGSCFALQHVRYGPLLNLVNKAREHKLDLSEAVAMYLTIELLRIMESIHACHMIHADLKPDNVLFLGLPELPKTARYSAAGQPSAIFPPREASVRVIDFGRSIDMTMFPPGTVFLAKVATSGFDCIEMRTDRPWTYQADYFGLAGTIHVLCFLEYMTVSWRENSRTEGRWFIGKKFKRWWHHNDLWERLFDELLNIPDCDSQPDIKSLREAFEARFCDKLIQSYVASASSIMVTMKDQFIHH